MAADYQLTLNDYLAILRRRRLLMAAVFSSIFLVVLVAALVLPPIFRSTGTILIEAQQIPSDLVQSTVTGFAEERIEVIRQRVMTRENLVKVADKYRLYEEDRASITVSEIIDRMRNGITVELISAANPARGARGKSLIAFTLSFDHRSPNTAHRVANELVTLYLNENVKTRTERAAETTEFLTKESERLKAELDSLEQQIAAYKQEHGNALPEHQELRLNMFARIEGELKDIDRQAKATQDELRFLDIELSSAKSGGSPVLPNSVVLSPAQELERHRTEYVKLSVRLHERHPDMVNLKRKIDALAQNVRQSGGSPDGPVGTAGELAIAKVEARIATANERLVSLEQQKKAMQAKRARLEKEILQTPQVERSLATLMRDLESARKKYDEIRSKEMTAQLAENLEEGSKAERFSLLEPPMLPDKPIKPDRIKIILMGLFGALGGAGGLVFLLETVHPRVRGGAELAALLRHKPLVVVPYITTRAEQARRKRLRRQLAAGGVVAVITALVLVHFLYMSLDLFFLKLISRLS